MQYQVKPLHMVSAVEQIFQPLQSLLFLFLIEVHDFGCRGQRLPPLFQKGNRFINGSGFTVLQRRGMNSLSDGIDQAALGVRYLKNFQGNLKTRIEVWLNALPCAQDIVNTQNGKLKFMGYDVKLFLDDDSSQGKMQPDLCACLGNFYPNDKEVAEWLPMFCNSSRSKVVTKNVGGKCKVTIKIWLKNPGDAVALCDKYKEKKSLMFKGNYVLLFVPGNRPSNKRGPHTGGC